MFLGVIGAVVECLNTYTMGRLAADVIARVLDDFRRNQATARRIAGMRDDRIGLIH